MRIVLDVGNISPGGVLDRGLFGPYHSGVVGVLQRLADTLSYFTYWSNILLAVVVTLLWWNPGRESRSFRYLRCTAVIMITLTGILYAALIAPTDVVTGWNIPDNILVHYVTPTLSVVTWVLAGPRGWFRWRESWAIYPLPLVYLGYTLVRGALIHRYPYGFFNVVTLGYSTVVITMIVIIAVSYLLVALFIRLDQRLSRRRPSA